MPESYIVKQGDHLSVLAEHFGFHDYRIIWDHPENAELKKLRKNPHVLFPGDCIIVPDRVVGVETRATDQAHAFVLKKTALILRLVVKDFDDLPVAHIDCELQIGAALYKLKTDGNGKIQQEIPKTAQGGTLRIPELGLEMAVNIGHLDPITEKSGWCGRLSNLGYHTGEPDDEQLRCAIEEFQCDYELPVTGVMDSATKAKIEDVHGC